MGDWMCDLKGGGGEGRGLSEGWLGSVGGSIGRLSMDSVLVFADIRCQHSLMITPVHGPCPQL